MFSLSDRRFILPRDGRVTPAIRWRDRREKQVSPQAGSIAGATLPSGFWEKSVSCFYLDLNLVCWPVIRAFGSWPEFSWLPFSEVRGGLKQK